MAAFGLAALFAWASSASAALTTTEDTTGPVGSVDDREPAPPTSVMAEANLVEFQGEVTWDLSVDDFVRQAPAGDDFTSGGTFVNTNDVASYQIWRSTLDGDSELIGTVDAGEGSYTDTDVESGVSYTYAVTAVDGTGNASTPVESETITFGNPGEAEVEVPKESSPVVQKATLELDLKLPITPQQNAAWDAADKAQQDEIEARKAGNTAALAEAKKRREEAVKVALADPQVKAFADDFVAEMARLLNIDPARITITRIKQGSVIVDFEIADAPNSPASDAVAQLNDTVQNDPKFFADAGLGALLNYQVAQTTTVAFGNVQASASATTKLAYSNGSADSTSILIVSATVEGVGFSAVPAKLSLGKGQSGSIDISFAASAVGNVNGTYPGTAVIITNDPNNLRMEIALSATVVGGLSGAVADVSTVSITFPRTTVGVSSARNLVISNKGGLSLAVNVQLNGGAGAFALSATGAMTIAGGKSDTIKVTFSPTSATSSSASVSITTDDATHPQFQVALSGSGVPVSGAQRLVDPSGNEILGDFVVDAVINFDDFFAFADYFGLTSAAPGFDATYDLVEDGVINFDDFFTFADYFGKTGTYQ